MTTPDRRQSQRPPDPVPDERIEVPVAQAEHGFDAHELLRRRAGRPAMGSAPAAVESVRLDPELKRDLLLRASAEGVSVSEVIRRALRKYVAAAS